MPSSRPSGRRGRHHGRRGRESSTAGRPVRAAAGRRTQDRVRRTSLAGQIQDQQTSLGGQDLELADEQRLAAVALQQDHLTRCVVEAFGQRPERGDADAGAGEEDPGRVRARLLSRPYGPSKSTRVPGCRCASRALPAPRALAVIRRLRPLGAVDSENGLARVHPFRPRNRTLRNCPARTGSRSNGAR